MSNMFSEHNQPVKEKRKHESLDETASHLAAFLIDANPNACFDNMLHLFLTSMPEMFLLYGTFIEGWYVVDMEDEVVVNEHAWGEVTGGKLIDPTVVRLVPPERPVFYFAGVERSWLEVKALTQKENVWFPYVRCVGTYGADGLGHPSYKAAYEAATRKVFELAHATQPPKKMTFLTAQDPQDNQQDRGLHVQMFFIAPDQNEEEQGR